MDKSSNKWVIFPRPNPAAALRLFCFHYAGESAQVFHGPPMLGDAGQGASLAARRD